MKSEWKWLENWLRENQSMRTCSQKVSIFKKKSSEIPFPFTFQSMEGLPNSDRLLKIRKMLKGDFNFTELKDTGSDIELTSLSIKKGDKLDYFFRNTGKVAVVVIERVLWELVYVKFSEDGETTSFRWIDLENEFLAPLGTYQYRHPLTTVKPTTSAGNDRRGIGRR
eukprot:CAMPEP_0115025612 /NCGR_PEP_ID=MMETSP0216-20121206/34132_1 /TAXON_ID=223996 /ORGANISM="Protocruzia adherens, Strain Boccale" /LENGTH=166 /DNA_ID=CAMNT_0002400285 /DNA_START=202 /DNA_END=702 /DNA_ORIENTATION=-